MGPIVGPLKSMGPGVIVPPCPPSRIGPDYRRITVINHNLDLGRQGPLNLIFTNQFKWTPNNNIDPGAHLNELHF